MFKRCQQFWLSVKTAKSLAFQRTKFSMVRKDPKMLGTRYFRIGSGRDRIAESNLVTQECRDPKEFRELERSSKTSFIEYRYGFGSFRRFKESCIIKFSTSSTFSSHELFFPSGIRLDSSRNFQFDLTHLCSINDFATIFCKIFWIEQKNYEKIWDSVGWNFHDEKSRLP